MLLGNTVAVTKIRVRQKATALLGLTALISAAGCGAGNQAAPMATPSTPASLTLSVSNTVRAGETVAVHVTGSQVDVSQAVVTVTCSNGTSGGCGSVSSGAYTAPTTVPTSGVVTLNATVTTAGGTPVSTSASVSILNPIPVLQAAAPLAVAAGMATITLSGSGFTPQSTVSASTSNSAAQVAVSSSMVDANTITLHLTTPTTFTGQVTLRVANPDPGAMTSTPVQIAVTSAAGLSLIASSSSVRVGQTSAITVVGNAIDATQVVLTVSCQTSGNSGCGAISSGVYTAPPVVPTSGAVTITGTIAIPGQSPVSNSISLNILNAVPVLQTVAPLSVQAGTARVALRGTGFTPQSSITVTGSSVGQIQSAATYLDGEDISLQITTPSNYAGTLAIEVSNPDPGAANSGTASVTVIPIVTYDAAVRFLRQSTYGPTPALIAHVQSVGFSQFLDEQIATPPSLYNTVQWWQQQRFSIMRNAVIGNDQLRQRVSQALSEIIVSSEFGQSADQSAFPIWMNTLQNDAFANYGTVIHDAVTQPALAAFLTNIGNNATADPSQHVSQNLGRELLQLFSVGPYLLNLDGTIRLDSSGNPIPTYSNTTIDGVSRALTGWNFQCSSNIACMWQESLAPYDQFHDKTAKVLLNGVTTSAGASSEDDLKALVNNLIAHPNTGPFVSRRLIQALVSSNPSSAYVSRVAQVFENDGSGTAGNLAAVVRAILLDPEARMGDDPSVPIASGHLGEPILFAAGAMRALNTTLQPYLPSAPIGEDSPGPWSAADTADLETWVSAMGQAPLYSPSVFNFYSFQNTLPGSSVLAPELQIETSSTVIARANYISDLLYGYLSQDAQDVSWLVSDAASSSAALVSDLNHYLMANRMDANTCSVIAAAVEAIPSTDPNGRIRQGLYLFLTSPQYQVIQ